MRGFSQAKRLHKQRIERVLQLLGPLHVARHADHHRLPTTQCSVPIQLCLRPCTNLLNYFYARFDPEKQGGHPQSGSSYLVNCLSLSTLSRVNVQKAAGQEWNARPCAQSLCRAVGQGLHRHFKSVPVPGSCPHRLQPCHHRTSAEQATAPTLNHFRPVTLTRF